MGFAHLGGKGSAACALGMKLRPKRHFKSGSRSATRLPSLHFGRDQWSSWIMKALISAAAIGIAALSLSAPAFAGECPADKVGVNVTPPGAMEPSKVTDTVISAIDLSKGYNIAGKQMRMRKLVIQPGGIVPWHSHTERPANIYVVSGAVTEYRSTCSAPIQHTTGEVVGEAGDLSHWWKNNTKKPAVLISADIVPTSGMAMPGM
jgi:quercetin dioxygenase-like cupin family protein